MKVRFIVCLLFLTFFVARGRGQQQTPPNFNGYWWSGMTPSYKLGWVSGYAMAMDSAASLQMGTCMANMPLYRKEWPNADPKVVLQKMCLSETQLDFDGIAMGQFADGIDSFYSDYRNKQLDINWAIQYARDAIKGKPASELDAELALWRGCSAAEQSHPMPRSSEDAAEIAKACTPETPHSQPQ